LVKHNTIIKSTHTKFKTTIEILDFERELVKNKNILKSTHPKINTTRKILDFKLSNLLCLHCPPKIQHLRKANDLYQHLMILIHWYIYGIREKWNVN